MKTFHMQFIPLSDDSDDEVCQYVFHGLGRLILETIHGQLIIDIRSEDVNSFRFDEHGQRIDTMLAPRRSCR